MKRKMFIDRNALRHIANETTSNFLCDRSITDDYMEIDWPEQPTLQSGIYCTSCHVIHSRCLLLTRSAYAASDSNAASGQPIPNPNPNPSPNKGQ